jgi:hypothetical protein
MTFRYQKLHEDIYDMMKRRKMGWCELGFAIYLRGKALRFGNPFFVSNNGIILETGTSEFILRRLRDLLQVKGVIKYDIGNGKRHPTTYYMLDSVMIPQRVKDSKSKGQVSATIGLSRLHPTIYNKEYNKEIKQKSLIKEKVYSGDMSHLINEVFPNLGGQNVRLRKT